MIVNQLSASVEHAPRQQGIYIVSATTVRSARVGDLRGRAGIDRPGTVGQEEARSGHSASVGEITAHQAVGQADRWLVLAHRIAGQGTWQDKS